DPTSLPHTVPAPLPWLPPVPPVLLEDAEFGPWLTRRAHLVAELADAVRDQACSDPATPGWVTPGGRPPDTATRVDVEVWRAATRVDPQDRRPTGALQYPRAAFDYQRSLRARIHDSHDPAVAEWRQTLADLAPGVGHDPYLDRLAHHLAALSRTGITSRSLLHIAAAEGPLPDDHAASALWWRITRHLAPDALTTAHTPRQPGRWIAHLTDLVGDQAATQLREGRYWSTLTAVVDDALERGFTLADLLRSSPTVPDMDPGLSLICSIATLTSGPTDDPDAPPEHLPPADIDTFQTRPEPARERIGQPTVAQQLAIAAALRPVLGRPEPTAEDQRRMFARADAWRDCPLPRARIVEINQLTHAFYTNNYPGSWAQTYLTARFHTDLTGHPQIQPGYAPAGWTSLIRHLHRHGVTAHEMLIAGVATHTRTGRIIDQFRDRITLPITDPDGVVLGFVGRCRPEITDPQVPKYLNTRDTPLFHKADQYYGTPRPSTTPVIVEGPMDAIAITLTDPDHYTGLAPLGTALTDPQASLLFGQQTVIIATDADPAGHAAAARDYWQLTPWGITPTRAPLPQDGDPASLFTSHGPDTLRTYLKAATPAADQMITDALLTLPTDQALTHATRILAASPPATWEAGTRHIATILDVDPDVVHSALAHAATSWNTDPRKAAHEAEHDQASLPPHQVPATANPVGPAPASTIPASPRRTTNLPDPSRNPSRPR
ncbi:MAG: toprim domain-containing protein, partial [Propionibacteriaceae bacterium]